MKTNVVLPGLFFALIFTIFVLIQPVAAATRTDGMEAFALDTVAGFGTVLKSSHIDPGQKVVFTLQQPSGTQLFFETNANSQGLAIYELNDYYTRQAGIYYVSAELKSLKRPGAPKPFRVYADSVSAARSSVEVSTHIVRLDQDSSSRITVTMTDAYGNPLAGHEVRVISSRNTDTVHTAGGKAYTDAKGFTEFVVSSRDPGVSTYTVYDMTGEIVLERRIQILFTNSKVDFESVGGDDELLADTSAAAPSTVYTFEFEELPEKIYKSDPTTLTLAVYDAEKNVVTNYSGKIHFSVTSDNENFAKLPDDYTFQSEDLGKHTFSLAFQFQQEGDYKMYATDAQNENIYGEKTITVSGIKDTASTSTGNVALNSPSSGKSRENVQTIAGSAVGGKDVKIFDNNVEIGKVTADSEGKFSYRATSLSDGEHSFYAAATDEKGTILGTSDKVTLTIDSTPPEITSITFEPFQDVPGGDPVTVKIISETNLTKASISVEDTLYDITADTSDPSSYSTAFPAPAAAGEHKVKVFLTDELGNEVSYDEQGSFTVAASGRPSAVSNINIFPANGQVNLVWGAARDDTGIKNYRIYYGTGPDALTENVDTFDNETTWYIRNLQNGTEYFFKIVAVDVEGQEGEVTPLVSGTPDASLSVLFPAAPNMMGETGPEMLWLFLPSFLVARWARRRKSS